MFLISLKAGGFGLNLTEADYVFLLDPWWNPASEAQAVDRTHRIGQARNVMVYRLVAKDTIEEKVMALKAKKSQLFADVMEGDALTGGALTAEDLAACSTTDAVRPRPVQPLTLFSRGAVRGVGPGASRRAAPSSFQAQ